MLTTRIKIQIASIASAIIRQVLRFTGQGPEVTVKRNHITWQLDLREGIDLAIYLAGAFERSTFRAYSTLLTPGDTVLDAGANIGAHALPLARCVGPAGVVLAAEPTDYAFQRLQQNTKLNAEACQALYPVQAMLAATEDGELESGFYSSWPVDRRCVEKHSEHQGVMRTAHGAIRTTVDKLLESKQINDLRLMKLDVDGYELDVLRGAAETLRTSAPIIIMELAPYTLEERGQKPFAVIELLQSYGYVFSALSGKSLAIDNAYLSRIKRGAGLNVIAYKPESTDL